MNMLRKENIETHQSSFIYTVVKEEKKMNKEKQTQQHFIHRREKKCELSQ